MFALIIVHQIIGEIVWCIDPIFIPLFKRSDKQLFYSENLFPIEKKRVLNYEFFPVNWFFIVFCIYMCSCCIHVVWFTIAAIIAFVLQIANDDSNTKHSITKNVSNLKQSWTHNNNYNIVQETIIIWAHILCSELSKFDIK